MLTMELNIDAFQIVGRFIPALIVVLAMIVRLANEARQQRKLAKNFNIYSVHNDYTKGEK
jgi:hypothetical protein